ncbi:hypothetical protein ABZ714_20075 [Streptomyces sp. NPDC006798]|uniref:hypothetical protein n=1 Tax=Streptomyces sp. NPDC006798 TaxID=3155462 RepID=UPI0033CE9989
MNCGDAPGRRPVGGRDPGDAFEDAAGISAAEADPEAGDGTGEPEETRRRRRAAFLRELHEAKALRERVQPRRARAARMRQQMRMRTFRW